MTTELTPEQQNEPLSLDELLESEEEDKRFHAYIRKLKKDYLMMYGTDQAYNSSSQWVVNIPPDTHYSTPTNTKKEDDVTDKKNIEEQEITDPLFFDPKELDI